MTSAPSPPPGWYPDPSGAPGQRYFDGQQWTTHAPPAPKKSRTGLWIGLSLLAAVVLCFGGCAALIGIGLSSEDPDTPSNAQPTAQGLFKEIRDGKFEFVVNSTTTLAGTPPPGVPTPMGEWRMVSITVTNIGDQTSRSHSSRRTRS